MKTHEDKINLKDLEKVLIKLCNHSYIQSRFRNEAFLLNARIAQLVEHNLAKVGVASSSLVSRS